jgi:hypothetical protein
MNVKDAFARGAEQMKKALGTNFDPELKLYETLKPADFYHLEEVYGPETVERYIRHMELRRQTKNA